MSDAAMTLAYHRMEKAEERYTAAQSLLNDGLYIDSVDRSYHAVLQSIRAVLSLEGMDFGEHSGVIGYFRQRYIENGIFPGVYYDYVSRAWSLCRDCEYQDFFTISKNDADEQLEHAREVLNGIKGFLDSAGAKE